MLPSFAPNWTENKIIGNWEIQWTEIKIISSMIVKSNSFIQNKTRMILILVITNKVGYIYVPH